MLPAAVVVCHSGESRSRVKESQKDPRSGPLRSTEAGKTATVPKSTFGET